MIPSRSRLSAVACGLLFAAASASAADQDAPAAARSAGEETTPPPASDSTEAKAAETAAAPERICRHVKLDASSRRKTKVCRTVEEWRELNNIR